MRHTQEKSNEIPKKIGSDIIPTQKGILTDFWKRANRVVVSVVVGVTRNAGNETSLLFSSVRFEIHSLVWRVCVCPLCVMLHSLCSYSGKECVAAQKKGSPQALIFCFLFCWPVFLPLCVSCSFVCVFF